MHGSAASPPLLPSVARCWYLHNGVHGGGEEALLLIWPWQPRGGPLSLFSPLLCWLYSWALRSGHLSLAQCSFHDPNLPCSWNLQF